MAGSLERLGLSVRRRLGRVHTPKNPRTHISPAPALREPLRELD